MLCEYSAGYVMGSIGDNPLDYFEHIIDHCYDLVEAEKKQGRPIVGIMCEFTPRELILAAGAWPVCLCGGSAQTIPPAEQYLPANLCPLVKSTFGYCVQHSNPFLEWSDLVVAETTCDGKKKMYELMRQFKPFYVLELPQKAADPDARAHWIAEVHKLHDYLQRHFQVAISTDALRAAAELMNQERRLRRQLAQYLSSENPPLTGRQLLACKSMISGIPQTLDQFQSLIDRIERGERFTPARPKADRAIRVLLTGVPLVHGAERVIELIEQCGAIVVCQENCTGLKPLLEDVDSQAGDIWEAIADKYFHLPCSVMTPNERRMDSLRTLARQYRADCIVELVWQACLTYDVESYQVRQLAEKELQLPYLKLTTDYSPSDSARLKVRIEALMETVRQRASAPGGDPQPHTSRSCAQP